MRKYNTTAPVQVTQNIPEGNRSGTNDALLHKEAAVEIAIQHALTIVLVLSPFFVVIAWKLTKVFNIYSVGDRLEFILYALLADWGIGGAYYFFWLRKWNQNIIRMEYQTGEDLNKDGLIGKGRRPTMYVRLSDAVDDGPHVADTELEENARNVAYLQAMAKELLKEDGSISQNNMKRLYGMPQGIWKSCTDVFVELHLAEKQGNSKNSPFDIYSGSDNGKTAKKYLKMIAEGDWEYLEDVWSTAKPPSPQ